MNRIILFLSGLLVIVLAGAPPAAQEPGRAVTVLKLAHALPATHTVHQALEHMGRRVAELSGQTVEVKIFPDAQLGTEVETVEQMRRGTIAAAKISAAALESTLPDMAAFGMPYVFRNEEHYWHILLGDVGKEIMATAEKGGLHGLGYYDAGSRSFYTVAKPILKPADLKGLKLRVQQSAQAKEMVGILRATPVSVEYAEVLGALERHTIDGAENNPPSFYTSRHYTLAKHYSLDEHTRVPDVVMFSRTVWEGLPARTRAWVEEAFAESQTLQRRLWREQTDEALKQVQDAGVKLYRPDQSAFALAVGPMYTKADGTRLGEFARRIMIAE